MSDILTLKSILSEEEQHDFIRYLSYPKGKLEGRYAELFAASGTKKETALKANLGSNTFNVQSNRLKKRLIDFMVSRLLETEESLENQLRKQLIVSRKLLKYNQFKLSFKLLLQSEITATEAQLFSLVLDIQHTLIEYAHAPFAPHLDELQQRSIRIQQAQQEQIRLNLAYSKIKNAYQSVEYQGETVDLSQILKNVYSELEITEISGFSFSALHQLVQLADIHGAYTKNYSAVNRLFVDKLRALQATDANNEKNSHYHLEILYSLAHIYFRKKDFELSLQFLGEMEVHMKRFSGKFPVKYSIQAAMIRSLNLNHLGNWKAAMEEIQRVLNQSYTMEDTIQIRLALGMIQFQQGELRACQQTLSKFSRTDAWYQNKLGVEWTLHKLTMEVLLHIELENYDFAESRLASMLRKYAVFLRNDGSKQARPFLRLVQELIHHPHKADSEAFRSKVESSIHWRNYEEEDVFYMNFYAWLRAKMNRGEVYRELLRLLN